MKYHFSIKLKLILYILSITLGAATVLGLIGYNVTKNELKQDLNEKFFLINTLKTNKVDHYFSQIESSIELIENNKYIKSHLPYFTGLSIPDTTRTFDKKHVSSIIVRQLQYIKDANGIKNLALISEKGEQLFTTGHIDYSNKVVRAFSTDFQTNTHKINYSDNYLIQGRNNSYEHRMLAKSSFMLSGQQSVFIICELNLEPLIQQINDTTSLKSTGETLLFRRADDKICYINPLRHDANELLRDTLTYGAKTKDRAEFLATNKKNGFGTTVDYRNEAVLAYWDHIPKINWGIMTKMDIDEAYDSIYYLKGVFIILGLIIAILTTLIITIFSDNFIKPIIDIKNNLIDLYNGSFPKQLYHKQNDEIKQTTDALNALVERLRVSTDFASKIGKGDLNAELDTSEYGDVLNKSLMNMRNNIVESNENEEKRNWTMLGHAYLNEALRSDQKDFKQWSQHILNEICQYTNALVGVTYLEKDAKLNPVATFAYQGKKLPTLDPGQSLTGQAYKQNKLIQLQQQPEHYLRVSTTMEQVPPKTLLFIPISDENKAIGVIELGFLQDVEPYKATFLEAFGKELAASMLSYQA